MCRIERSYVVGIGINVVYLRVSPKRPKDLFLIRNVHHHMYPLIKLSAGGRTMAFENEGRNKGVLALGTPRCVAIYKKSDSGWIERTRQY